MAVKQPVKRRRGRPLKEESNAIAVEKAILDGNTTLIALIPDAIQVLKDLMTANTTKDNIRENIAKCVIEKGEALNAQYNAEDEAEETEKVPTVNDKSGSEGLTKPFTTDIIPLKKAEK